MDHSLSNSTPMDLLSTIEDSPLCNSIPRDLLSARERLGLEREERATARRQRRCERDRERRRSEQAEVRQAKLDRQRVRDHERRAAEQSEARQARLATDRQRTHERRAAEQPEARQARLERLRERNREQRAAEQVDARQARLARNREASRRRRQAERQSEPHRTSMPALEDEWVQGKLAAFHAKMSSLPYCQCSCCNESFPSMKLTSGDSVCSRCSRDKQEPKLYSAANNMDPGSVPLALQGLTQVDFSSDANYECVPTSSRSVWLQWACYQPTTGCSKLCPEPSTCA